MTHTARSPLTKASDRFLRPILLGSVLALTNSFWVTNVDGTFFGRAGMHLTAMSIFFNVLFCLFVIVLLNLVLRRYFPYHALSQGEILIIYLMMNLASGIAGHGFMQIMSQIIAFPFWYATPENEWTKLIQPYIPSWISVRDMAVLEGYYQGESSLYTGVHFRGWALPVIAWTGFIFAFISLMFFINLILRRQWIEKEKLAYPTIQLPSEMIHQPEVFFKNRLMWLGFSMAAGIDLLNGLSFLFPTIPHLYVKMTNIGRYLNFKPFAALGWMPVAFYPFIIGLGFLIPAELSFSFWFFYLVWKGRGVLLVALGQPSQQLYGFDRNSIYFSAGALLGLCGIALWQARRHLLEVVKSALRPTPIGDEVSEPVSYQTAFIGLGLSSLFLIGFCYLAGMSWWVAVLFFIIYYAFCLSITRMRAEMGVPVHDYHNGGPDIILPELFGTRALGATNLTIMAYFWFFNRAHYSDVMPHQLEGFKMALRMQLNQRRLMVAILVGTLVGILGAFWAFLHYGYEVGMRGRLEWFGFEPFNRLQSRLTNPREPNLNVLAYLPAGTILYVVLAGLRNRFFWWPLHPVGFAVSNSWGANVTWFPVFIGWALKVSVLRWGGRRTHMRAVPFFLGLMLGEFAVGTFWSLFGTILGGPHYSFFPYGR